MVLICLGQLSWRSYSDIEYEDDGVTPKKGTEYKVNMGLTPDKHIISYELELNSNEFYELGLKETPIIPVSSIISL